MVLGVLHGDGEARGSQFSASLCRVGPLPILLRTIFAAQKAGATRIMVVADPNIRRKVRRTLFFTGRLPESVEWIEAVAGPSHFQRLLLTINKASNESLALIDENRTYPPS